MDSRRRGATWLLGALLIGRVLDAFDLPFEKPSGTRKPPEASADSVPRPADGVAARPPDSVLEPPRSRHAPRGREPAPSPLRINHATAAELQRLPGVGPVLAERIVAERQSGGPFRNAGDLERVRGIGTKTCTRLAPHLRFD